MSICLEGCSPALLVDDGREYMMGIDEAGRGPTLGPMVYGSAFCAVDDEPKLRAMGFNDSKQLTEAKRDQLWDELQSCGFIGWRIRVLEAKEISEGMLRRHQKCVIAQARPTNPLPSRSNPRALLDVLNIPPTHTPAMCSMCSRYNLNAMSHDAAIGLVRGVLATGVNLRYLYVDTVGDPERYQAKLADLFPTLQVVVEKKADAKFPVVSAASICAKVPRDKLLDNWPCDDPRICSDRQWGCGYPGDKDTQRWVKENLNPVFGWPDIVRFSWGPSLEILDKNPQAHGVFPVAWPDDDAEAEQQQQQRDSMAAFLGRGAKRQKGPDRHRVLHDAMLEPVVTW